MPEQDPPIAPETPETLGSTPDGRRPLKARLILAFALHFLVLGSWYCLRPLREEIATFDPDVIAKLWTRGFLVMLVLSPMFAFAARHLKRKALCAGTYFVLISALIGFAVLLPNLGSAEVGPDGQPLAASRARVLAEQALYVFMSMYTLFAVSVMWSYLADVFRSEEASRWFGPIAAAGTLGGLAASKAMEFLPLHFELNQLLWLPAGLLTAAALGILFVDHGPSTVGDDRPPGKGVLAGIGVVFRSKTLLAIVLYMVLASVAGAFRYQIQSTILNEAITDRGERTSFYAGINTWTNGYALLSQLFLSAWLMKRIGVGFTLAALPIVAGLVFATLGGLQAAGLESEALLPVLFVATVAWRGTSYSLSKPTKEFLFTLVSREQKFASKNFIDTVVYRGGDSAGANAVDAGKGWLEVHRPTWLAGGALAFAGIPVIALWIVAALMLGRLVKHRRPRPSSRDRGDSSARSGLSGTDDPESDEQHTA